MNKNDAHKIKQNIIQKALPNIVFYGWNWQSIEDAAVAEGHSAALAHSLFPDGMVDVLVEFSTYADEQMLKALKDVCPDDMRIRDRVKAGVRKRLEILEPHKEAVRESLGILAKPSLKPRAAKMIWTTADAIWNWAGDTATDYNHYTKRGLLSGILVSTMLVWIDDASEDKEKTQNFLDRRIDNVVFWGPKIGKVLRRVKSQK